MLTAPLTATLAVVPLAGIRFSELLPLKVSAVSARLPASAYPPWMVPPAVTVTGPALPLPPKVPMAATETALLVLSDPELSKSDPLLTEVALV